MASSMTVKILEITRIKPSPESHNSANEFESFLPLTFFDTYWFKFPPVERLFFYRLNSSSPAYFISVILPKLKQSLSLTLLHYLPLSGNLKWPSNAPKPIISYTPNDGVSLTVAESDADFDRLSSNGIYEAVELHPLIPQLITSNDSASIIAVQITLFPDKGFSIGIIAHHTVLDGKTTTMFMKSWAYLCKQGNRENSPLPPELTPFFDRGVIKDPTGLDLDMLYLNQWLTSNGSESDTTGHKSLKVSSDKGEASNLVRATITITPDDFKKMRERLLSKSSDSSKQLHLSTFVLTLAYVTTCIVKARGGEGDRTVYLGFTADCRPRLDLPVPENYFGNCNTPIFEVLKARHFMDFENGFAFTAEKVSNMVKGLTDKGVFAGAKDKLTPVFDVAKEPAGSAQIISVAGSPRFGVYETDFGWGRPWKVAVVSIEKNEAISMAESRDGRKGIEVGLAFRKHEMERFFSLFLKDF
ncbi:phenolic glucoside malonyltransferase 1-like [Durio zibethinus]|uniref:Phenolic glucoside malonyltransferase 1-like n=1 Tax=Durio zibethinus TaxID=66656 RepID=A0A6P6B959_DURZI|nr:phenolic glucoside malonyltransferase 1-like [Durio zibethinus]